MLRDRDLHLMTLVSRALHDRAPELELSAADLEKLAEPAPVQLADVISISATVIASSPDAVAAGDYRLRINGIGGGAQMLGRFAHGSPDAHALVSQISRAEEALHPGAVFAEIVHLPEGRLGNILLRPVLRGYEIPFLGTSGAPLENQIDVGDLMVSVVGGRVVLRSRRLDREVIPRLTTAHNFGNPMSLAPYRFLCAHALQGASPAGWQWGVLEHMPVLPRVRHGRFILSRARWLLQESDLAPLRAKPSAAIAALRDRLRWPRWIVIADGDNELPIDLDHELMVDSAAHLLKGRKSAVIHELLPGPDELCARGSEGAFNHELVLFATSAAAAPRERRLPAATGPVVRRFLPGSEWLYVKLYTGSATVDPLLRALSPIVKGALAGGLARRWFFLRYGDPDWHLRLRFEGDPARLTGELLPQLQAALARESDAGVVWQVAVATYEREVERYGGAAAIELAESVFHADSDCVLGMVEALEGDAGLAAAWRLALRGMDRLLDDLGLSLAEKHAYATRARDGFGREFGMDTAMQRSLGDKYRVHRNELGALLAAGDDVADHPHAPVLRLFAERSARVRPLVARLRALEAAGALREPIVELAPSYVHMTVNRMMRSHQRVHELVLCDFLRRHYEGQIARAKHAP